THVAHAVLDIVAEDPQVQHVAEEVHEAAMHEHRGQRRQERRHDHELWGQLTKTEQDRWNHTERVKCLLAAHWTERDLPQEHEHTDNHERYGHHRCDGGRVVISQWDHDTSVPRKQRGRNEAAYGTRGLALVREPA